MKLTDDGWKELKGGYKITYDVSIPLRLLQETEDKERINKIYEELWEELHHQGDVGLASYLALPQLVMIGRTKNLFDWNLLGLCSVIEQQRHLPSNPPLPDQYKEYYDNGLLELQEFITSNIGNAQDEITLRMALSALATCKGQVKLGKAIMELDDDVLDEFLEQF